MTQVLASPLTSLALDTADSQGAISDANLSPVTPAGYAFSIWALIYAALPGPGDLPDPARPARPRGAPADRLVAGRRLRRQHRVGPRLRPAGRSGWPSSCWSCWSICLIFATIGFSRSGPAESAAEQFAFRLPITLYLGWATVACCAGFGTTFRSLGMPQEAGWASDLGVALVLSATIASLFVIGRLFAVTGFVLAACWALFAVAVATYSAEVRLAAVIALVVLLAVLFGRTIRSDARRTILLG